MVGFLGPGEADAARWHTLTWGSKPEVCRQNFSLPASKLREETEVTEDGRDRPMERRRVVIQKFTIFIQNLLG